MCKSTSLAYKELTKTGLTIQKHSRHTIKVFQHTTTTTTKVSSAPLSAASLLHVYQIYQGL